MSPEPTIIPVVPRRDWPAADGLFFDGETACAQDVRLTVDEAGGCLRIRGRAIAVDWPLEQVRLVPDQARRAGLVLRRADAPLARLFTEDRLLAKRFPALTRRVVDVSRPRLLAWALGALASVALIILVLVPLMADQLARYIPAEGAHALGDSTLGQIRGALSESGLDPVPFCDAPKGRAALENLRVRLQEGAGSERPLTVHVLDHPMVNAFALPGGHVIFMRGLIDTAASAEELAAVFAHEIGHAVSRDPTRHALRSAGSIGVLGLLFGDFAGGALVLFLAEQLIEAQYSQQAESAADRFAHEALKHSGIAPSALADIFERMAAGQGDAEGIAAHFLSHPSLGARIIAARAATPQGFRARPALAAAEWQALRAICDG